MRFHLYLPVCDMRKGFDGLSGLIREHMNADLLSGDVFIFINRGRDKIKLLRFEPGGLVLYYKRLEQGTFTLPASEKGATKRKISYSDLAMIIEGVVPVKTKQKVRYLSSKREDNS